MSKTPSEKYLHFTVGLLKGSAALEAFQEDALKHHMIDNPGQLIALRLSEYYEMMNRGIVQPVMRVPALGAPLEGTSQEKTPTTPLPAVTPPSAPFSGVPSTPSAPVTSTAKFPVVPPSHIPGGVPPSPRPMPQPVAEANPALSQTTPHLRALQQHLQQQKQQQQQQHLQDAVDVIFAPTSADQNADDAADYWTAL